MAKKREMRDIGGQRFVNIESEDCEINDSRISFNES